MYEIIIKSAKRFDLFSDAPISKMAFRVQSLNVRASDHI